MNINEYIWHKTLKRPYRLKIQYDQGNGQTVVLLHGLGGKGGDWQPAITQLNPEEYRVIALDLLGFGASPKPDWKSYSPDDHAKSVVATLRRHGVKKPYILVGHSMGAVVAARVARYKPKSVSRLVLYEVPVYADLPEQNVRDLRHRAYLSFFGNAIRHPERTMRLLYYLGRIASDFVAITLDTKSWPPFEKSLTNTVMGDSVYDDVSHLTMRTDVIYGRYDLVVIKRIMKKMFKSSPNIHFIEVNEGHRITARIGKTLDRLLKDQKP